MVARAYTVAFEGVEARIVEVQCAVAPGMPYFGIVGLADKAVSEAKERVRAAMAAMSIALPSKRIMVNLSPADLPKEGSHFDLPIALALLAALDIIPKDAAESTVALGELSLDGRLIAVLGALPAAMAAAEADRILLCPKACGAEAAWVGATQVLAAATLNDVVRHYTGQIPITPAEAGEVAAESTGRDFRDVKGQERAKRALEIAASGRHHALMVGTPGSGKSMLAARLPGILPPLSAQEALETSMIHSLAGLLSEGGISRARPFREPHHTASMAAIVGGGKGAKPGEISLAHNGVLFMDEFPEFPRAVLETLRQPIETGEIMVARANAHIRYPCRFLLIAAANPCKCGYMSDPARACAKVPICGEDYLGRISGPLMDRFDLRVEVPPVAYTDLDLPSSGDSSATVAARVQAARALQTARFRSTPNTRVNADMEGSLLEQVASPDPEGRDLLAKVAERFGLSARGYHRVLRVARTIADLDASPTVRLPHIAEAVSYRLAVGAKN
ncbi:ATPase AAA [Cypionkella aquatica]|uniref:ATPase AAA n=1 Tax=Cypionkella aquatica TaxID=1756042 RepID=A0AA37TPB2_9RHOB|nr:YifB family Mg chelatase-like AAA ATPase [Cypionkella aquatica]GLS85439.1 ATPase AAA [Cypionkella aquatica]